MGDTNTNAQDHIAQSMNAMLLLNSSCQAIVQTYIAPSSSPWNQQVADELGDAQDLVRDWRLSGFLYFSQTILAGTTACGNAIMNAKPQIETLFAQLAQNFNATTKQQLLTQLSNLEPQILSLNDSIGNYEDKLSSWNVQMSKVHDRLSQTIASIQEQESELQADIAATNAQIASMQKTIETDRQAIAKAKAARTRGIIETIFGVVFAPLTGGASLILAGIGVASIVEGEAAITALQSSITKAQSQIVSDQSHLNDDQKQVVSLQGIVASANLVMSDVNFIGESLDSLRTDWELLHQNLSDVITKITNATDASVLILSKVWFEASCDEWSSILDFVQSLQNAPTTTTHVTIG